MNVMTLFPYKNEEYDCWVFDDSTNKLKSEAFVLGASEMIQEVVNRKGIPNADKGFALTFGAEPFEGHDVELSWIEAGDYTYTNDNDETVTVPGNWFGGCVGQLMMICWLCPALFHYFSEVPKKMYVKADPLPEGADPIWHDATDNIRAYVEAK